LPYDEDMTDWRVFRIFGVRHVTLQRVAASFDVGSGIVKSVFDTCDVRSVIVTL
jgi:hypothetical protein